MNTKARLKFGIFVLGLGALVPAALLALSLLTQFITAFQKGADPASIFRGHILIIPEPEQAQWVSWDAAEGENPSQAEREEMIAAYWQAWEALDRAYQTGDTGDLATYWAGAAYEHALAGIPMEQRQSVSHSGHRLHLTFFAEGGSVAAFKDQGFSITYNPNGDLLRASAEVVMTLDQGFWRVRSIQLNYW
ncbi:MAG: hypothetical protein OHK0046_50390 [Anaerolineae bacterium]